MNALSLIGTDLALLLGVLTLASLPAWRTKDPSYIDALWGLGFVFVVLVVHQRTPHGDATRRALLVGLVTVWGVRLSVYLFARWRRQGPDQRYQTILGPNPPGVVIWLRVFVLQGVALTIVALPLQLGQRTEGPMTLLNWVGALVAATGIVVEVVADAQLARFKSDPANRGKVMDRGLWAWSRHPNYFGEATTWWGIGLLAWADGVTTLGLIGPAVITLLLLTRSGIGPLESQLKRTKPEYADYIARTSAFVPRPPRSDAELARS